MSKPNTKPVVKRVAGETCNIYYPINFVEFDSNNQIQLQIPASESVLDFTRGYLQAEIELKLDNAITAAQAGNYSYADDNVSISTYIGLMNAGNIFDQIQLYIGGRVIYDQQFAQVNQRLLDIEKSQDYIKWEPNTYVNVNDITANVSNNFLYKITAGTSSIKFNLHIPMEMICPVFRSINDWPAFGIGDTLNIFLNSSSLNKYMCAFYVNDNNEVIKVCPIMSDYRIAPIETNVAAVDNEVVQPIPILTLSDNYIIKNLKMIIPSHVPMASERKEAMQVLNTTGLIYGFRTYEINGQSTKDFGTVDKTQELCFNVTKNNIYGVAAIALSQASEVVFDHPVITNIDCSLNNNYHLDLNTYHSMDNWVSGLGIYQSYLAKNGAFNFKHLTRVIDNFVYDNIPRVPVQNTARNINGANATSGYLNLFTSDLNKSYGSYLMYYNVSPGDSIGISSNLFAHLIVLKLKTASQTYSNGQVVSPVYLPTQAMANENLEYYDVIGCTNHMNTRYYMATQTLNIMCVKSDAVDIVNPSATELMASTVYSNYKMGNYSHGAIGDAIGSVVGFLPKVVGGIHNMALAGNRRANTAYLMEKFGPDKADEMLQRPSVQAILDKTHHSFKKAVNSKSHGLMEHNGTYGGYSFDKEAKTEGGTNAFTNDKAANVSNINVPFNRLTDIRRFAAINNSGIKSGRNLRRIRYLPGQARVLPFNYSFRAAHGCVSSYGRFSSWIKHIGGKIKDKWNNKWKNDLINKGKSELGKLKDDILNNLDKYATQIINNPSSIKDIPAEIRAKVSSYAKQNAKRLLNEGKDYVKGEAKEGLSHVLKKAGISHGPLTYDAARVKKYYNKWPKASKRFKFNAAHGDLDSLRYSILRDKIHRGIKDRSMVTGQQSMKERQRKYIESIAMPQKQSEFKKPDVITPGKLQRMALKRNPNFLYMLNRKINKKNIKHGFAPMSKRNPTADMMGDYGRFIHGGPHGPFIHGSFIHGNFIK